LSGWPASYGGQAAKFRGRTNFGHWMPRALTFLDMLEKWNFKRCPHLAGWPRRWGLQAQLWLSWARALCHITWFTLPSLFSSFITQSLILPVTLFLSANMFLWWFTLKRYLCYTLYIVKAKENSKEFVWKIIMVDGEWCSEWG
jgi:hypothetical protein